MSWDWPKWWWINDVFRFLLTASALNFENSFLNTPKIYLSFSSLQHRLLQQFSYYYSCLLDLSNFELTLLKSIWQKFWSFCHFYVKWYQIMKFINIFLFHLPRNHQVETDTSKRRFWIFLHHYSTIPASKSTYFFTMTAIDDEFSQRIFVIQYSNCVMVKWIRVNTS